MEPPLGAKCFLPEATMVEHLHLWLTVVVDDCYR